MKTRWLHLLLSFVFSSACFGEVPEVVKNTLNQVIPGVSAKHIKPAPLPGWYQGQVGSRLLYVNADGTYLLDGQIFDLRNQENLTENALNSVRQELLASVDESTMIIFKAREERYQVTVFTDIDCGYCRKLHNTMKDYHDRGISVRYLAYPRAGIGSRTAKVMESAWCAEDRANALTQAKRGQKIEQLECKNPVEQHYELGNAMGVNGTPAILLDSGKMVPGFVDARRLIKVLEQES